jgi:hypothetical protein
MTDKTGLISFLQNTNSAFAADLVKNATQIHAFACPEVGEPVVHWRIRSAEDLKRLHEVCTDSWIRLLFIYEDGHTQGEDVWLEVIQ